MGDDGGTLCEIRTEPARVIEMVMRVHNVANRLVGNESAHFREHGEGAFLVQRRLDHRDKILEVDGNAVMCTPGDEPRANPRLNCSHLDMSYLDHCVEHTQQGCRHGSLQMTP